MNIVEVLGLCLCVFFLAAGSMAVDRDGPNATFCRGELYKHVPGKGYKV